MKKFLGYLITPVVTIIFILLLVIFQPIQWISFRFFGYGVHKRSVDILNLLLLRTIYLLGDTVNFINEQNLPLGRPIIFLANHQCLMDIPPMIWYLRNYHAKFISKIELTKGIPSISYNLKHGGGANINRKDARQSITELLKLGNRMKENNWSAVIFPEGTRSTDGTIKTFQAAGVATILKKCPNALLVPIAIKNSWKLVKYGVYPLNTFTYISWEVLKPIEPANRPVDELVMEAENSIRVALAQPSST